MRIIKATTPSQLVLRDRTLWISIVCFAAALFLGYRVLARHDPAALAIPALFLVGFGLVFFGATDVVFDRTEQVCRLRRISALGIVRARYRFAEIADVRVEIEPSLGHSTTTMCRLALVTAAGTTPLTRSYEPSLKRYNAMRDAIVLALAADLPLSAEIDPVQELVNQGRTIDAVALLRTREKLGLTEAHERVARLKREAKRRAAAMPRS
jgi:hypothetical protein